MNPDGDPGRQKFSEEIGRKEKRKLRARRSKQESIWYGLGLFGLVGWAVAVPTLIGVALGLWIDTRYPGPVSWTLTGLFAGVILGCINAWFWVKKERRSIERKDDHE